jgi:hypothetical protein
MKLRIRERLQKLSGDMFITDYAGDIVKLLVNKPKEYRFLYDKQADLYMICGAWDHIHSEMMDRAFRSGWYENQKDFIEIFSSYSPRNAILYFDTAVNFGFEFDEDDEIDTSLIKADFEDGFVDPWVYCFGFVPNNADGDSSQSLINDGYDHSYDFSFGTVYTRDFDLSECHDLQTALNRANK